VPPAPEKSGRPGIGNSAPPNPGAPTATPGNGTAQNPAPPGPTPAPSSAASTAVPSGPPPQAGSSLKAEGASTTLPDGGIRATGGVTVRYNDATITSDEVVGNINREVVFSGHARLEARGVNSYADAIHYFPRTRSFRLDNPHGVVSPELLQGRVLDPVYIHGGDLFGTSQGYALGDNIDLTTCIEPHPHYELRSRSAELFPHQRLVLRHTAVYLFGQRLIDLPYLVIPLDPRAARRPRTDYLPEFGQNVDEGYYVRFPYTFAEKAFAGTFLRLDLTQKRGPGYRVEQEYLAGKQESLYNTSATTGTSGGFTGATTGTIATAYGYGTLGPRLAPLGTGLGPQNGGLFAMQGYVKDGFDRNFNASYRHQQGIGGDNRLAFSTELRRNSFYVSNSQTSQATRFNFNHADSTHGVSADLTIGLNTDNSSGSFNSNSSQLTASYRQSFDFATRGANRNTLSYTLDASRLRNTSSSADGSNALSTRTAQLNSQFQFQHISREYSLSAQANKNFDIGPQSGNGNVGALERLPELQMSVDTLNFKGGWLQRLPAHLDIGVGRYSEPSHKEQDDRILLGLTLQETSIMRGRTEMTTGGGFEQRLYSDGAAQYILRNTTRLRQHLAKRSGFDLNYNYEQPEGGTPFQFDTFGRAHSVTAEGGYLDDSHFQLTARVGYDLLGTSRQAPFQSLSTRLMWRPTPSVRFDALATYDPNTSKFFAITNSLRLRGRNDFAFDLYTRYDPQLISGKFGKFTQINSQFDIPLGRTWRLSSLLRFNGIQGKFESRNLQLTHDWDCMEATLTYSENPLSFRPGGDRQIYFTLRIKAFPFFRSFARGSAGEAVGPGLGDLY
jgi:hypothetical protein